jgi:hypothetical protein
MRNELAGLRNFEKDLVKERYKDSAESRQVDSGHKLLQIFARTVKSKRSEGESSALRRCRALEWGKSRVKEADRKLFKVDQRGQAGYEGIWRKVTILRDFLNAKLDKVIGGQEKSPNLRKGKVNTL